MRLLFPIMALILLFSCKNHKNMENSKTKISRIEYHFSDSSVPPPYHRSYDITVVHDTIYLTVDSYGEILTDTSFALAKEDFEEICDSLPSFNIKTCDKKDPDGCVGGTGEQLKIIDAENNTILSGSVYYCGGESYGTLTGDLKGFGYLLKSKIPDFKSQLKE
ncbi:MAG: hypothetical protein JXR53_00055 [Bacteroidales bacterium]|nr:hypothetical protein [Bacteroidales bacterium]